MLSKLQRSLFFIVFMLFCVSYVHSQEKQNPKDYFVEAESFFLFEEFKDALPIYQKILRIEPENYNVTYKVGICYLNDMYQQKKAIKYLETAVLHTNPEYKINTYKEKLAPLEAHFYLAKAYRIDNQLDLAIESYQRFRKIADPAVFDLDLVDEEISSCQLAKKMKSQPIFYSKKNAGAIINSRFAEKNPVLSGDGQTLLFMRELQFFKAIFITYKDSKGNWSEPKDLTPDFGLDGNSYITGISFHGDELFAYRSDEYDGNIYTSRLAGGKWGKLEKLNDNINTKFWESHASLSPDGQFIYFTSNKTGGYGGLDIYKSKRDARGTWGAAVNLGPVINSPSNEDTPFLTNEGYSLFFSSQGHKTLGGYDIFVSSLQSNGTWGLPVNMGYPFNTTNDDVFYNPTNVNAFGYYALFDNTSGEGLTDIYYTETYNSIIPRTFLLTGKINLEGGDANAYKNIQVKLYDANTHKLVAETTIDKDGNYTLKAPQGDYTLVVEGNNFISQSQNISLSVTQSTAMLAIPSVMLLKAAANVPVVSIVQPAKQGILAKNTFYAVSDSGPVAIELILPKGSDLIVNTSNSAQAEGTESFESVKKRFTYFFTPTPGENSIKFTAIDPDGDTTYTEVKVMYYPAVPSDAIASNTQSTVTGSPATSALIAISTGALGNFLKSNKGLNFKTNAQLYQYLIEHAAEGGYTVEDVNRLFSIYYSQMDMSAFDLEFRKNSAHDNESWNAIRDSSAIPFQYINQLLARYLIQENQLQEDLIVGYTTDKSITTSDFFHTLNSYSIQKSVTDSNELNNLGKPETFSLFASKTSGENASSALQLSVTTDDVDFFFQNLLLASTGGLKKYLTQLNTNSLGIETAIDLVNHLFESAGKAGYTLDELIAALDLITANRNYYLTRFNEVLKAEASGNLKSKLQTLDLKKENIYTYEELLQHLLAQSQFNNYTRENVYDLYLTLLGVGTAQELADLFKLYNNPAINKALADTSLTYFSTPLELLQYLLSSSAYYDYTESDINNLLIRMILERGLENQGLDKYSGDWKGLLKNGKLVATIVLVNILLLLIIILLALRRKKNK